MGGLVGGLMVWWGWSDGLAGGLVDALVDGLHGGLEH